jgi:cyclomaltodextrinase / maltogenic alpha-amylase / neopullulanase
MLPTGAMNSHRTVELRVRAAGPFEKVPHIAVAGEISAWDIPIDVPVTLDAARDAVGCLSLSLPPGVYAYKLLVNGAWTLDPDVPRTRSDNKRRNHVLAVNGAPEPLLFAPGPPWISEMERGGVRIVAALRHGNGQSLTLGWKEPADEADHRTPMTLVGEEDEHLLFEALLPISSKKAQIEFWLENGDRLGAENGAPLSWQAPPDATPDWWRDAVVYTVFVDRFRPRVLHPKWTRDPGPQKYSGGHLDGVAQALPELSQIGVTVVYLTPIHLGANCHRYDMVDPFTIDPRVGGKPALERLLEKAHALKMRVALDFTCSHAGDGFFAYEDVKKNGRSSRYAHWFTWTKNVRLIHYGTRTDAPLFNVHDADVRAYFLDLVKTVAQWGIDALRLDAAAEVPFDFARQIRQTFQQFRPDGLVFAEFVHLHSYRYIDEQGADATTEFGFFDLVAPFLASGHLTAAEFARRLLMLERERGAPAFRALRFLCTHDHPRLATLAQLRGRAFIVPLGFLLLFTVPGIPMLLYGEELGLWADRPEQTREDVWPDRMSRPWPEEGQLWPTDWRSLIAQLTALRRQRLALREGALSFAYGEDQVLVYRREANGEIIDIAMNTGKTATQVELDDDTYPEMDILLRIGHVEILGKQIELGKGAGVILRRYRKEAPRKLELAGGSVFRDRDFIASNLRVSSQPTRIDIALTERCNLRCAHCITHAPARTSARQAREWSPWLIDRLRDDLAHAEHIGFVHGGESLVSSHLYSVLQVLQHERLGLPTTVHLLTNGILLTAKAAEELAHHGVKSIAVSLDGATASTNDAIRQGGRFPQIIANLREVAKVRREKQLDLRLGISMVVLEQNVGELEAMVDLTADLGFDWLKLEEAVPINIFAEKSLVRLEGGFAADAVRKTIEYGRKLGIVMVDHTVERSIWRCQLEQDTSGKTFLEADGFANRTMIHPCRSPWEIANIEANGDVRLGSFFGPVLGNVAETSLALLWNGPVARQAREQAMASRPCKKGPVTCLR